MLRHALASARKCLYQHPRLYRTAFNLATCNIDYLRLRLQASHYPSAFGGLWTDRDDFPALLAAKTERGELKQDQVALLENWRRDGILRLEGAFDPGLIDDYLEDIERLKSRDPSPLLITSVSLTTPQPYSRELLKENYSPRTVDDYFYLESARKLLFQPAIEQFLALAFERRPILTQSLNFERGSEQAMHQDTAFVRMNSPMKVIGVWIALEDIKAGSGELVYYPGSHRWPDYFFSRHFKHYDEQRDGQEQLRDWYQWINDEASRRRVEQVSFRPKKGDVLFWHAGLAHGGAPIADAETTRRSLVAHYCPLGVRPLYHYYKPAHYRRYRWQDRLYSSSYYR